MKQKTKTQKSMAAYAIVGAFSIAIILVGLGYASYVASDVDTTMKSDKEDPTITVKNVEEKNTFPPDNQPVDTAEIDRKIDELDKEFKKEKKTSDFDNDGFSDKQLGL